MGFRPPPAQSGSGTPTIQGAAATALGATKTVAFTAGEERWLVGTLSANLAVTTTGVVAGSRLVVLATQPSSGGPYTLTIDGQGVEIPTSALALAVVSVRWLDTDTFRVDSALPPGSAGSAPTSTLAPAITGTTTTGQTLTCSTGSWTGSPTSYAYAWKRDGSAISGATSSTYVLQVADEGTSVKCTVTATNATGSTPADSNTVTPSATATAPGQVTGLSLTPGDGQLVASWSAPSNGGSAITDYLVQIRNPGGSGSYTTFADGTSTSTGATITGLTNGTSVDVKVSAINAIGTGTASSVVSATPTAAGTPDTILGADLTRWFKPETLGADTTAITTWTDSSGVTGGLTQGTSGRRPVVAASVLNGYKAARFDGVDDRLQPVDGVGPAQPCEVWMVCKMRSALDTTFRPFYTSFSNPNIAKVSSVSVSLVAPTSLTTTDSGVLSGIVAGFHAYHFVSNGASSAIRVDNVSKAIGDAGTNGIDSFTIGCDWSELPADIDLVEMVVVDRISTSGERTSMQAYFASKFGI